MARDTYTSLLFSPMSAQPFSTNIPPSRRKRKRDAIGVTMCYEVLAGPSPTTGNVMQVLHTNAEEHTGFRKSSAPISRSQLRTPNAPLSESWSPAPVEQAVQFEEGLDTADTPPNVAAGPKHKKRKNRNDSVSSSFIRCSTHS